MRAHFDLWATERENAAVVEHGLRVHKDDSIYPVAMIWHPKASKPTERLRFKTAEKRDEYVQKYIGNYGAYLLNKQAQKEAGRELVSKHSSEIGVGHVFRYSWGYDQTNVEFLQVIAKSGQSVTVREIAQSVVPGSEGYMSEQVKPRLGHFLEKSKPVTKRLQFTSDGRAYLAQPFGWCELWRGEASYQSHYH